MITLCIIVYSINLALAVLLYWIIRQYRKIGKIDIPNSLTIKDIYK